MNETELIVSINKMQSCITALQEELTNITNNISKVSTTSKTIQRSELKELLTYYNFPNGSSYVDELESLIDEYELTKREVIEVIETVADYSTKTKINDIKQYLKSSLKKKGNSKNAKEQDNN